MKLRNIDHISIACFDVVQAENDYMATFGWEVAERYFDADSHINVTCFNVGPTTVEVLDTKEKGSDVSLAAYLLVDGFESEYEVAIIVSADSDLVEPIRLAIDRIGVTVGVLHPYRMHSAELSQVATFYRPIRERALKASQFSTIMHDADGEITKPSTW